MSPSSNRRRPKICSRFFRRAAGPPPFRRRERSASSFVSLDPPKYPRPEPTNTHSKSPRSSSCDSFPDARSNAYATAGRKNGDESSSSSSTLPLVERKLTEKRRPSLAFDQPS